MTALLRHILVSHVLNPSVAFFCLFDVSWKDAWAGIPFIHSSCVDVCQMVA